MKSKYLYEQNKFNNNHKEKYDYDYDKSDENKQQKSKPYEYYPDKSKNGGNAIFLVAEGNEKYKDFKNDEISEYKDNHGVNIKEDYNEIIHEDKKDDDTLVSERSIELQIYKGKFIFFVNGLQTFKQGNFNNNKAKNISKDIHNIKSIDSNINPLNTKEYNDETKIYELNYNNINDNNKCKNKNSTSAYIRKITENQSPYKENGIFNSKFNLNSKTLNQSNLLKYNNNYSDKKSKPDFKIFNLNEIIQSSLTKNNSLFDLFPKIKNTVDMNHSYDNKDNINSFYNSLEYFKNNINKVLDRSKVMEKSFLSGMKNEDRRNSLKNAITIYNRFKSFGKLKKMNLYSTPLTPLVPKLKLDIFKNYENDDIKKRNKNMNKKDNNKVIESNHKDIVDTLKNDKNNDENKIIINSKDTINIQKDKENESVEENNNEHEFSFSLELKKKLENKENENIEENSKNNILKDNKLICEFNTENKEQSISDNKRNKQNKVKKEKEKENNNMKKLNKSMDIKRKNHNIKSKSNDYDLDSNNNINKSKEVQTERIKYKNPSHFIRKVIREEHYYIDKNGKEKLLEVKQRLINEENNKGKLLISPYIKKNLKIIGLNSQNKKEENKKMTKAYFNTNSPYYKIEGKEKDAIKAKFKKINRQKKKTNLTYLGNGDKDKSLERTMKKYLELDESNLTEIIPDSFSSKNNDIFKDFNNLFFKNKNNDFNKKITAYNETKTQQTKIDQNFYKEPISVKQKNMISFNNLNNNNFGIKKDISSIKKERPIIIKSCVYYDNSPKLIRPKPSLNKNKYNNLDGKNVFNYYKVKKNNNKNEISDKKDNVKSKESKEIYSYIKVNKMENFKKIKTEKILNINNLNRSNYSKRDFNKNHAYHEIKVIKNSPKRLSSNSQSNYFSQDIFNDELNSSHRTHIYSVNSFNNEKQKNLINMVNSNIQKDLNKTMIKQKNFKNNNISDSYFILNSKFPNQKIKNKDKKHHRYFESKSTKKKYKESDNESEGNTGRTTTNYSITLEKNLYKNDSKDRYFYQNWGNTSPIQNYDI